MKNVIALQYNEWPVRFSTDGWFNATAAAGIFGKEPRDWLRLHETESYMRAFAKHLGIPFDPRVVERKASERVSGGKSGFRPELSNCAGLVITKRGASANGGGTWLHPKLAVAFARWLSPDFAVWCDMQIDSLLYGEMPVRQRFDRACTTLEHGQQTAGVSARQLAEWRWKKPELEQQVEHWRGQLQLMLGPDMD